MEQGAQGSVLRPGVLIRQKFDVRTSCGKQGASFDVNKVCSGAFLREILPGMVVVEGSCGTPRYRTDSNGHSVLDIQISVYVLCWLLR